MPRTETRPSPTPSTEASSRARASGATAASDAPPASRVPPGAAPAPRSNRSSSRTPPGTGAGSGDETARSEGAEAKVCHQEQWPAGERVRHAVTVTRKAQPGGGQCSSGSWTSPSSAPRRSPLSAICSHPEAAVQLAGV